jgi:hypothetical protein
MGRRDWNAETVLVFDRGRHVGSIRRIVFGAYDVRDTHPDAAGVVNYRAAIAVVRRDGNGALFLDRAEPLLRDYRPLTGIWN